MNTDLEVARIREEIHRSGFSIVDGLIDEGDISAIRDYWLDEFQRDVAHTPLIWGPYLGEPNRKIFDRRETHCLFRAFDFLWNEPFDSLSRQVALDLNRIRNTIVGCDERDGEFFDPKRYGIYVTTSYYPSGSGWLHRHQDEMDDRDHWHFVLPLTFRGSEYTSGGLRLIDRDGHSVDVEAMVSPGSVIFYDGKIPHWVEMIEDESECGLGRLQLFAIPVRFEMPAENNRIGADLPLRNVLRSKVSQLKQWLINKVRN